MLSLLLISAMVVLPLRGMAAGVRCAATTGARAGAAPDRPVPAPPQTVRCVACALAMGGSCFGGCGGLGAALPFPAPVSAGTVLLSTALTARSSGVLPVPDPPPPRALLT